MKIDLQSPLKRIRLSYGTRRSFSSKNFSHVLRLSTSIKRIARCKGVN